MPETLLQSWLNTVRRHRHRRAVVEAASGRSATFAELDALARSWLATHAPDATALRGRAVVFSVPNGIDWFVVFLGVLHAGAVAVPLDAAEPATAQRALSESLRAGFWWNGRALVPLVRGKQFRSSAISLIKLTSGSTGRPRPLAFTATQLLADARQVMHGMRFGSRDLNYALIPLGHSYGLGNLTLSLIANGVPLVCGSAALPHAIADDFARWRPTVFPGVPAVWRALAASDVKLPGLRLAISAGAELPPVVAAEFLSRHGRHVHNFYGSSETGGVSFDRSGRHTLAGGVGKPLPGISLRPLRGQRLEVSGPAVFTHGHPRRRGRNGAWMMPDLVQIDGKGALTLVGRRGTIVKIGGRRVSLAEVTAKLRALAGVSDAWVALSEGPEPILGAVIVSQLDAANLRAAAAVGSTPWKIPRKWIVLASMPHTARGKLDTAKLRQLLFGRGS